MKKEKNIFTKEHSKNLENWAREIYFYKSQGFVDITYFGYKAQLFELKEAIQIYIPSENIRFHIQGGFEAFVTLTEKKTNEIYELALKLQKLIDNSGIRTISSNELVFLQTQVIFVGKDNSQHVVMLKPPVYRQPISFETEFGFIRNESDFIYFIEEING